MNHLSRPIPLLIYAAISFWYVNGLALFSQSTSPSSLHDEPSLDQSHARWHLRIGGELSFGELTSEFLLFSYLRSDLGFYLQQQDAGGYFFGKKSLLLDVGIGYQLLPNWRGELGFRRGIKVPANGPNSRQYFHEILQENIPGLRFYSQGEFKVQAIQMGVAYVPLPMERRLRHRLEPHLSAGLLLFLSSLRVKVDGEWVSETLEIFPITPFERRKILPVLGMYGKLGLDFYLSPQISLQAAMAYQYVSEGVFPAFTIPIPDVQVGEYRIPNHRYQLSSFVLQTGLQFHIFAQ